MSLVPNYLDETFMGYARAENRGVGTRNYVVVFSASSLCSTLSFCFPCRWGCEVCHSALPKGVLAE